MSFSAATAGCAPAWKSFFTATSSSAGRRLRAAAGFVIFLFLLLPSFGAAEIFLETRVGFHGVFQLGRPFPLEIELSNNGRPAEGMLLIQTWKGGATKGGAVYPVHYRREIFLAAGTRKTVQFTIDPDFISRPVSIKFTSAAGNAERELDLRRNFSPGPVLLWLSEGSLAPSLALGTQATNRLVALSLPELPADARALLGVSHLILYDVSLRELSRAQLTALDTWLIAGGRMVILGSLNYALYQEPALSRFLPVRVSGTRRISFNPGSEKTPAHQTIDNVWAQIATPVNGEVTRTAQGLPLLVENRRGKGGVTYLAVDVGRPPLSEWPGLPQFLQTLVNPSIAVDAYVPPQWDDGVFTQLILNPSFIATYVPTGSLFVGLVAYFTGLAVLGWMWQKKRLGGRHVLTCLIGWVALSSLGGFVYFSRGGNIPDGVLLVSSLIENSSDGFVESQSNLALFSTQSRGYDLQPQRGWLDLTPVAGRSRDQTEPVVINQDGGGSSRYHLPLREWDYRLLRMRAVTRFALRAQFDVQGDKLVMKIDNPTSIDLIDCWLFAPGQRYSLGEIRRGASWTKTFALGAAKGAEESAPGRAETVSFRDLHFADKTRDILFHTSFFTRDNEARWNGAAIFFGWIKDPEPRVRIDDPQMRVHDYSLFRAIVPLASGEDE